MQKKQHTLSKACLFEGKGLHTGAPVTMKLLPAPEGSGIRFRRTDLPGEPDMEALAEYVTHTTRCTTLAQGQVQIMTAEHLLSALTGMGIDNVLIELDNAEVPILDGSARPYAEAILAAGIEEQGADRRYIEFPYTLEIRDGHSGSWIRLEPAKALSAHVTIDFSSEVLGGQNATWNEETDYATQIAPCRTFCFYREVEPLLKAGLIKGGDLDNALVITDQGYMGNPQLHFPDECGRHKLLDLVGDLRLAGGYLHARIEAFKPGHTLNTKAAKALRALLK